MKRLPSALIPNLNKSRFLAGWQCLRRLYWQVHGPSEEGTDGDHPTEGVIFQGEEVALLARQAFPNGRTVGEAASDDFAALLNDTRALMAKPAVSAVFLGAFEHNNIRIRTDILKRVGRKGWHLIEVKASTDVRDHHVYDIAIQRFVLESAGIPVVGVSLMHINRDYVYDGHQHDLKKLFIQQDLSVAVDAVAEEVRALVRRARKTLLASEPPEAEPDVDCNSPFDCEFFDRCHESLPDDHILLLHGNKKLANELLEGGIESIRKIPTSVELNGVQDRMRRSLKAKKLLVEPELKGLLRQLKPPIYYMDFETANAAIPFCKGTKPYHQTPFQWSVHVQLPRAKKLQHHEFLAEENGDPRLPFLTNLLEVLEQHPTAPIVVYNQAFEKARLTELGAAFPKYAKRIGAVNERLWDLLPVVRNHVYHPAFRGSFSIKMVLPALVPDMGYENMPIADGMAASAAYIQMRGQSVTAQEISALRAGLLAYCGQDTLAMKRVIEELQRHCS